MSITQVVQYSAAESGVGLLLGSFSDWLFPQPDDTTPSVQLLAEAGGQILLNAFVVAMSYEALRRRGIRGEDPTMGVPFIITFLYSQPNLGTKVRLLSNRAANIIRQIVQRPIQTEVHDAK